MSVYKDAAITAAAGTARWAALTKVDVDVSTLATWDPHLPRNKRILVPIDVQAMVAPAAGAENTVPISGTQEEPEPFATGTSRAPGVQLHWAMPDALLRGQNADRASGITLPLLPDRWVVIRTLLPEGSRLVHVRGWVIEARTGAVTSLADWPANPATAPAGTATHDHLDGSSGGTLLWSATYTGATNRFALRDDLADLPALAPIAPNGFHGGRAVYTVAGWWSDAAADPLASCRSRGELTDTLHSYGWHISAEAPDADDQPEDPRLEQLQARVLKRPPTSVPTYEVDRYRSSATRFSELAPAGDVPVAEVAARYIGIAATHYHSLLHGSVLGVPITGEITGADDRPAPEDMSTAIGLDLDDVTAALAAPGFGTTPENRQTAERLMAAFTSGLLARIATTDGVRDIQEQEHADGFWPFAGAPLRDAKDDRLRAEDSLKYGPTQVGRKGRGARAESRNAIRDDVLSTEISWSGKHVRVVGDSSTIAAKATRSAATPSPAPEPIAKPGESRTVAKAAPRLFRPAPAVVAVRGLRPSARHHGDGLFDPEGLRCRWPGECRPGMQGVVDAAAILPTLGNGAIPADVLQVVREAVTLDPYSSAWLAQAGAPEPTWPAREARIRAEHVRLFGPQLVYDGSGAGAVLAGLKPPTQAASRSAWGGASLDALHAATDLAVQLADYSIVDGAPPSPVAITTWRQPWVPLFVEWRVRLRGSDTVDGWQLGELDLTAPAPLATNVDRTFVGRSPITTGIAKSLSDAMQGWLDAENARDAATPSQSQLDEAGEAALAALRNLIRPLDLVSCSLDGIREQLLGIDYVNGMVVRQVPDDEGGAPRPVASGAPVPLFGGQVEVLELRAVDAFGRVQTIPLDTMRTTSALEVPDAPATIALAPRVQNGARWLFRFVDPSYPLTGDPRSAPEAYVDQVAGRDAVTPLCGYLLPDHMDESLEVFDRFGTPIGELVHDAISEAVRWEPAPGRPVPPDAGPLTGVPGEFGAHAQHVGLLASGLIERDVASRHADEPATRSALSALLRAIDTTLWTVDTLGAVGSPTIAGLVGRPVAVVRATLRLEAPDDADELTITAAGGAQARRAAFAMLAEQRFPVRIGDLGRSDDAVLGFFVDDDYTRFHVVDKVVASSAFDTGRHRWHLGLLGETATPAPDPIDHPYLEAEDTLQVKPGQVVRLTILMLPAGKVHLTTGIVPRKALVLPDDWTAAGLRAMVPSLRVGPVLVDPAEIRLPKIASLPQDQNFIRRTGPLTWKEDPIVAATSAALLPKLPHEAQEGWVRVAPAQPPTGGSAAAP
jgi:hypothetical protein